MRFRWNVLTWSILSLGGLALFAYSMVQQTNIQQQMNGTMTNVNAALAATTPLVAKTSQVLSPLAKTTEALYRTEQSEQQTVIHLAEMNTHLSQIAQTERILNSDMDQLYARTTRTNDAITAVFRVNQSLLSTSQLSAKNSNHIAAQVGQINQTTRDSVTQLSQLNQKLSALKLLP